MKNTRIAVMKRVIIESVIPFGIVCEEIKIKINPSEVPRYNSVISTLHNSPL
jgi:hypothetical protein